MSDWDAVWRWVVVILAVGMVAEGIIKAWRSK